MLVRELIAELQKHDPETETDIERVFFQAGYRTNCVRPGYVAHPDGHWVRISDRAEVDSQEAVEKGRVIPPMLMLS
jgi:hypothetical protein